MTSSSTKEAFGGMARLYSQAGLKRLREAHVGVIGIGGVGSWAAEALARSGIGTITLVDPDDICVSNINRQLHATHATVGQPKIDVMADRIRDINPHCTVLTTQKFYRLATEAEILATKFDYVIDAIDAVMPKAGMIAGCRERNIPIVTCGGSGGKMDPTQIRVSDIADVSHDRLIFYVRKKLRSVFKFPPVGKPMGVSCVHSPEIVHVGGKCVSAEAAGPFDGPTRLNCEGGLGAATFVTGAFGFHAAAVVVNALATPHRNHL